MFGIPLTATALKASLIGNVVLVVLLLAGLGIQQVRVSGAEAGKARAVAALADERSAIAAEREKFSEAARLAERKHESRLKALAAQREQEKEDAEARIARTVDEHRRGVRQLRQQWAAEVATARLAGAVAAAAGTDAAPDDRAAAVGRVLRIGAAADRQIRELQGVVLSMHATCSGAAP
jgi:hypothetical protein